MVLGIRDHRVLAAFVDKVPSEGRKLWTDGQQLSGYWMGGARIAEWRDGGGGAQIVMNDLGSRAAQSVQRALRRHAAPVQLADWPGLGGKKRRR